jgi:hypothetical protein
MAPFRGKPRILTDDHLPLQQVGIRAIDIIDFTYLWHHTPDDSFDKVKRESAGWEMGMAVVRL